MKILITGAGGFVGQTLASSLLSSHHTLILTDLHAPPIPIPSSSSSSSSSSTSSAAAAVSIAADLTVSPLPAALLPPDLDAIFVLHGIMSAGAEADLDLGYRVNLHATLSLLDAVRAAFRCRPGLRLIYASSCAVYGGGGPALPSEATAPTPEGSYGAQKLMAELAVNDLSRRGLLVGFCLRLPSIVVRGGPPAQAASAWMSAVVREPLNRRPVTLPVLEDDDDAFRCWVCSPRTLVRNLERCLTLPPACLPRHARQVLLPGVAVSVGEMLAALREVGGEEALRLVHRERPAEAEARLFESWPQEFDVSLALEAGFEPAGTFLEAVREYAASLEGE